MDTTTAATVQSLITGIVVSVLTLIYWEVKARAARARTGALASAVEKIPAATAQQVTALTGPASDGGGSAGTGASA